MKAWTAPINSPQAGVLQPMRIGDRLQVVVNMAGVRPVLEVRTYGGALAGSLTFVGYLEVINCITNRGATYEAVIVNISGGFHEVRVERV